MFTLYSLKPMTSYCLRYLIKLYRTQQKNHLRAYLYAETVSDVAVIYIEWFVEEKLKAV